MTGAGFTRLVLPRPLPTPVLAFAIRELGCVAGVMVTASHNPPQDNGYKVYLGDGSQIVPPADAGIAARDRRGRAARPSVPRGGGRHASSTSTSSTATSTPSPSSPATGPRDLDVVYTPLHGVGGTSVVQVLETRRLRRRRGWSPQQEEPDPDFPTVAFPNPEEPGAMDLALALAARARRRPRGRQRPGRRPVRRRRPDGPHGWRMLRGDEVGALLADHLLRARPARAPTRRSIVSSSLLGEMAAAAGAAVRRDPDRVQVDRPGRRDLAFGYEEALGYCVDPEHVRDKDGVSALLLLVRARRRGEGRGPHAASTCSTTSRAEYGLHATDQLSVRVERPRRDRRRHGPAARHAAAPSSAAWPSRRSTTSSRGAADLPPTDGPALPAAPTAPG